MRFPTINIKSTARTLFILILLGFFFWQFLLPAMAKFRDSGYIFDHQMRKRLQADSPAITFCRMDNFSSIGWKNVSRKYRGFHWRTNWAQWFCKGSRTVDDIIACMDKNTFNHDETIDNLAAASSFRNFNETANHDWTPIMTSLHLGKVNLI